MKNMLFISALFVSAFSFAQTADSTYGMPPKFFEAMKKNVAVLDTATVKSTFQQSYNSFDRLNNAEKSQWLPSYYMAYCLLVESYMDETSKTDDYCDQASHLLDHADSISPNNSEILVLRSMCASARIRVNPMTRGGKYGKESGQWLDKAQQADSTNPRIAYLRGTGLLYTPPAFGGGKDKAKPVLQDALKKFDAFRPASPVHPNWGRKQAEMMLAQCDQK
ncbi:MAG TPA: hypothetical protein VFU15_13935 [Bacteroidia bacterium]|nr:hypothetical protein [Bacteroidia bacterium]